MMIFITFCSYLINLSPTGISVLNNEPLQTDGPGLFVCKQVTVCPGHI
jgi:hypothetical protein